MADVKLENVTKQYENGFEAVKSANIEIRDQEFMVLVGPSGCGKSTLLRMIAGLEEITSGTLQIDGEVVNDVSPRDRDIAMVFQNYALYPHMTVFENMAFGLRLRKYPDAEINTRVNEAADILGLTELLQRKPKEMSGGQRQRVAVGRAIVRKPKVFLFDEPLSNLDAKLRVQMRLEISRLHQQLGATMIYVTHDQTEAMTMGNRITVLKDGLIQQIDSPMNLYNYPRNRFVAGFIGSPAMNFFSGKLKKSGTGLTFENQDITLPLDKELSSNLQNKAGENITLGIRPEHFTAASNSTMVIQKNIDVVEPVGNETYVYFQGAGDTYCVRLEETAAPVKPGESLSIGFDSRRMYFYDDATGNLVFSQQSAPV
jgi:multiple sugar transport system ATP-binding protein